MPVQKKNDGPEGQDQVELLIEGIFAVADVVTLCQQLEIDNHGSRAEVLTAANRMLSLLKRMLIEREGRSSGFVPPLQPNVYLARRNESPVSAEAKFRAEEAQSPQDAARMLRYRTAMQRRRKI